VHPAYQGQGLSRRILDELMECAASLPNSTGVSLVADADWLYHKYGFAAPVNSMGMSHHSATVAE